MPTGTPNPTGVSIRKARAADADAVLALFGLIDLHATAEEQAATFGQLRIALTQTADTGNRFLVAENADGTPVGALHCGPARWMFEHPRIPAFMRPQVPRRISSIQLLAVHRDHRGHGIGHALVHHVEDDLRRAGIVAVTLRHKRGLERFYRPLGYTSSPRLALNVPPQGLITQVNPGWKHAVKPLGPGVSLTTVQGLPTLTGMFPA